MTVWVPMVAPSSRGVKRRRDPESPRIERTGLLRREELLAMTRRAPSIFRDDRIGAAAEEAVVDADLGDVARGALGLAERCADGDDAAKSTTCRKLHAPRQIIDAVEFELGAPVRGERVFKAGAEHEAGQGRAAVRKIANNAVIIILGKIEPARRDAGLGINQRAADRDTGARREIGAPDVAGRCLREVKIGNL